MTRDVRRGAQPRLPAASDASTCTPAQVRFWFEEQLVPQNAALVATAHWQVDGPLVHALLEEGWRRLIDRHPALRAAVHGASGEPVQSIAAAVPATIPLFDLRVVAESDRAAETARLSAVAAHTPFDIGSAPLIRLTRLLTGDTRSLLVVTAHALVCDRVSLDVLLRELRAILTALHAGAQRLLPALPVDYRDAAGAQHARTVAEVLEPQRNAVRELLRGCRQFELPADRPRPRVVTANGDVASMQIGEPLCDALAVAFPAADAHAAPFVTLLAALYTLFYRYTGETDILVCTDVDGRGDAERGRLVGAFTNTIGVRADLSGNPAFAALRERVRASYDRSVALAGVPLAQIVELADIARDPSRNPLFSIRVTYATQDMPAIEDAGGDITVIDVPAPPAGVLYDLDIACIKNSSGLRISCAYNTDLYERPSIDGMLDALRTLLVSAAAEPQAAIDTIAIISDAEREALVAGVNRTEAAYPHDSTLLDLIARQAAATPDAVAVRCADAALTYAELDRAAAAVAARVTRAGAQPGARVGILLDRSCEMLAALLGVLRAGCAYVPLDPTYPPDRIAFIASDGALAAVVTRRRFADRIAGPVARIEIADLAELLADEPSPGVRAPGPTDVAYVIYTSGSTGRPKGVAIPHRALVNLLWAMRERPGCGAADTLLAVTTIAFDIAGLELFLPLITGATVVIARETDIVDGDALFALLQRSRATIMQATPVTWQLLLDAGWHGEPRLRMLCGGEALPRALADRLLACGTDLWNMYGPTETTVWSSASQVTPGTGPVPIGPPIANTAMYVLDGRGAPVPRGVPGELYIGGAGVALHYHAREALTRERFVPDTFAAAPGARMYRTGDIVRRRDDGFAFLGRTDHQVKLRGFRIELDEIAAALLRRPGVAEAAVITAGAPGAEALHAYVVAEPGAEHDPACRPAALRREIAAFLPKYMLPSTIAVLERLPRTPNGKLDRAALPDLTATSVAPDDDPPCNTLEIAVAKLAGELLGRERIGRSADLFALGLHSLTAVRLIATIDASLAARLPVRTLFERPTIAGIAAAIEEVRAGGRAPEPDGPQALVRHNPSGDATPLVFFHNDAHAEGLYCRRLAAEIGPSHPLVALAPHGSAGLPLFRTVEEMARDHIARLKAVLPHGPYALGGHCYGGLVAFEAARQLRAGGDIVTTVILSNVYGPIRGWHAIDLLLRRIGLDESLHVALREKLCANIARFAHSTAHGPAATLRFLSDRARSLLHLGRRERRNAIDNPDILLRPVDDDEHRRRLTNMVARCTYHPAAYDGDVTLIWSADEPIAAGDPTRDDPTRGWRRTAAAVRVVSTPGTHVGLIRDHVGEYGRLLAAALTPP